MKYTTIDLLSDEPIFRQSEKLQTKLECKFVLLTKDNECFLIFGPLHTYNYHAQLLEKFCVDRHINSKWQRHPDTYKIKDSSIKINGGGWLQFDFFQKTLTALGMSTAYGRFDQQIFEQIAKKEIIFKDFTINVKP